MRDAMRYLSIAAMVAMATCIVAEEPAETSAGNSETPAVKVVRPEFGGVAKGPGGVFVIGPDGSQLVVGDTVIVTTDDAIFTWEIVSLQVGKAPGLKLTGTTITRTPAPEKKKRRARDPFSPVGYTP